MDVNHSPTRQQILELLKRSGGMTVDQLSGALGISAMGVRQHLAVLERDGLVESGKKRGGMGRPAHVYNISPKGDELFPRDYAGLATTLLDIVDELDGQQKVDSIFQKRMERLYAAWAPRLAGKNLRAKLEEIVRIQDENGALPEFGQRPGGYYLNEHNCVIARVARKYPIVCQYEQALLQKLLGTQVEFEKCIAHGDSCCAYFIQNGTH